MSVKKPNLLIIGYYHLADGFRTCANFLEKEYDVYFFPLCHYIDSKFNVKRELIKYVKGEKCEHYECGLRENNPAMDIVLFWNMRYFINSHEGIDVVVCMKNEVIHRVLYLGYNWDPMPPIGEIETLKLSFIRLMNGYLTCDGREIKYLKEIGEYNYVYCPPGFDPNITHFMYDPKYECDVSMICTNLYTNYETFPRKYVRVHRKELVDLLYSHRNEIKFHLYGPPVFAELYGECYKGCISYEDCSKVFTNSKINLCIHATSYNNYQNYAYFSERLPQIMGAHGLVYSDTEYDGLLKPDFNYILADATDPLAQIKEIIKYCDSPKIKMIKDKGYDTAIKSFTWVNMLNKINMIAHRDNKSQRRR